MPISITNLRTVIARPPADAGTYVWTRYPLRLDARCVLGNDRELRPKTARKHRLTARLPVADVLAIVRRAVDEKPDATPDEILTAVDGLYFFFSDCR